MPNICFLVSASALIRPARALVSSNPVGRCREVPTAAQAWRVLRGALFTALALSAAGGQATTLNTAQLFVSPSFSGGSGPYTGLDQQHGAASLSGSATGGRDSSGAGTSFVTWGVVKLAGEAFGSLNTTSRGIFRDEILITAPGVARGTVGTVSYSIIVDGALVAGPDGDTMSSWNLEADLGGGAFDIRAGARQYGADLGGEYVGTPFGTFNGTGTFQFGIVAPLHVELTAGAQARYNQTSTTLPSASFDVAHSLYWGGISGISLNGAPLSGFSISAASGTNYIDSMAPPVPEPGTLALMVAGLGLLAGLQRHRRR
jgi:hypothetical protein